jgi:hypothetical protein
MDYYTISTQKKRLGFLETYFEYDIVQYGKKDWIFRDITRF